MSPATPRPIVLRSGFPMGVSIAIGVAAVGVGIGAYTLYPKGPVMGRPIFDRAGFHSLRVHSTELVNHNTKRVRLALPDGAQPSGLQLTSAVLTVAFPGGGWKPCVRPYTPVNDLREPGFIELLVKHYPNGRQSTHIHALKPGDTLTMMPIQGYAWTPNKHPHVVLIAGGAGITPMYQLTRGILANPADRTRISLVWGVNTDSDIFLADELAALQKQHPDRLKVTYVVSSPEKASSSQYATGYVTKELLEKAGLAASVPGNRGTKVLVCGPPPMEKALTGGREPFGWGKGGQGILAQLGYSCGQIHKF